MVAVTLGVGVEVIVAVTLGVGVEVMVGVILGVGVGGNGGKDPSSLSNIEFENAVE
jgi:hypothetical protein